MIFTCSNCHAQYKIGDDRIPSKGAKVKCKKCGNIITIKPPLSDLPDSESFQNGATVVQRSPFAQEEETGKEATRVVSAEQAAGIFKNLIEEHSRSVGADEGVVGDEQPDSYSRGSMAGEWDVGSPDDRLTSVYETQQERQVGDEVVERQVDQMLDGTDEEEDISREATRVVSTDQLKEMVGEQVVSEKETSEIADQSYYPVAQQSYVVSRSRGEWYVAIGQMQVGPLSLNEVEEKWGRGEINSTTLVWKAGMAGWQPLMYIPELSHLVPPSHETKEVEQPPIKEFTPESGGSGFREEPSTSSAFPSFEELSRQEEKLKSQKEDDAPLNWRPAAGDALASLVQDEMESIQRGFSTDIPLSDAISKPEERLVVVSSDLSGLPFEKPVGNIQTALPPQNISTPPVTVMPAQEQPVIVSTPYQQPSYPPVYPSIYSQPSVKRERRWFVPVLIGVFALVLVVGSVLGYIIYTRLAGEKIQPQNVQQQQQVVQSQQPSQQQQQQVVEEQPPKEVQPPPQEEKKEETQKGVEAEEPKKEEKVQKIKTAKKEERPGRAEKQIQKRQVREEEELPPPRREEPPTLKKEVAKVEDREPPKKKPQKGSDALLDFEDEGGSKGSSGGLPKTLTQEQILEVVKANIGRIKSCMAGQAERDSSVKGKLVIGWEIQSNGKTRSVQIKSPQFKGTYIGTCLASVVSDFTFPKFSGPPIPIEFPFNIK